MHLTVEIEQEEDGRWIAEVVDLPGVLVYLDFGQFKIFPRFKFPHLLIASE
jgi:hypothetical protein